MRWLPQLSQGGKGLVARGARPGPPMQLRATIVACPTEQKRNITINQLDTGRDSESYFASSTIFLRDSTAVDCSEIYADPVPCTKSITGRLLFCVK